MNDIKTKFIESGKRLSEIFSEAAQKVKPGVSALEIDELVAKKCRDLNCTPLFLGHHGFPKHICLSFNEEIVHSIPGQRVIKDKDLVTLDLAIRYNGFCTDMARTFSFSSNDTHKKLIEGTRDAFWGAVDIIKDGVDIFLVGKIIQNTARGFDLSVIPDLTGHGIGKNMWEEPYIFNVPFDHFTLNKGKAIAIEPIFSAGGVKIQTLKDNWTIVTKDKSLSAHYENTVFIEKDGCEVVTCLEGSN
jgi:methionyl aminopeptidase